MRGGNGDALVETEKKRAELVPRLLSLFSFVPQRSVGRMTKTSSRFRWEQVPLRIFFARRELREEEREVAGGTRC